MTCYFFHLRRGDELIEDLEGEEFPDLDAAKVEAIEAARELVALAVRRAQPINGDRIEITDESGRCVDVVRLSEVLPPTRSTG